MCKSLFTFDIIKASLLLVLKHEVVANRLTINAAFRLEITCSGVVMIEKLKKGMFLP